MSRLEIMSVDEIDVRLDVYEWPFLRSHRAEIDAFWRDLCAQKPSVYDGRVLLMHAHEWQGGRFRGLAFETSYSAFITWKRLGFPGADVQNFFGMAALRAQDGAFLLGEMGAHTANAGQSYFPAGTPEPADVCDGIVDLAGSVLRECAEETGLQDDEIEITGHWSAVLHDNQFALMRDIRVKGNGDSARRAIEANLARQTDPELARIHVVRQPADSHGLTMPGFMQPFLDFALA